MSQYNAVSLAGMLKWHLIELLIIVSTLEMKHNVYGMIEV